MLCTLLLPHGIDRQRLIHFVIEVIDMGKIRICVPGNKVVALAHRVLRLNGGSALGNLLHSCSRRAFIVIVESYIDHASDHLDLEGSTLLAISGCHILGVGSFHGGLGHFYIRMRHG